VVRTQSALFLIFIIHFFFYAEDAERDVGAHTADKRRHVGSSAPESGAHAARRARRARESFCTSKASTYVLAKQVSLCTSKAASKASACVLVKQVLMY
jgi:hypothetical protein